MCVREREREREREFVCMRMCACVRACVCVCARARACVLNVHSRVCIPCTDTPAPHVATLSLSTRIVSPTQSWYNYCACRVLQKLTLQTSILFSGGIASDSTRLVLPLQTKSRCVYSLVFRSDNTQLYTVNTNKSSCIEEGDFFFGISRS